MLAEGRLKKLFWPPSASCSPARLPRLPPPPPPPPPLLQDLNRDVARIDTVPTQYLDTIKDWLTSIEIKYYESKV